MSVRNPDGSLVRSVAIGAAPSFIEPWTFARGQTVVTERTGIESGNVTVTLFDVPPDVTGATTIEGAEAAITIAQPGQNGSVTFGGSRDQRVVVHVTRNTIGAVTINVVSPENAMLTSITSSAASFTLPAVTLASTGAHAVIVDPRAAATGTLHVSVTSRGER